MISKLAPENKKLGTSLALTFAARGVSIGGVLILTIVVNHGLGLEQAGEFFFAYIALNFCAIVARYGMDFHIVRRSAATKDRLEKSTILAGILRHSLLLCLVLCALILLTWFISGFSNKPVFMIWVVIVPVTLSSIVAAHLRANQKQALGALLEAGIFSAITAVVLSVCYAMGTGNSAISSWWIFSLIAWCGFIVIHGSVLLKELSSIKIWPKLDFVPLRESLMLGHSNVLAFTAQWGAVFIIGLFMTSEAVAIVNGIFRLVAPLQFLFLTLDGFLAPRFAENFASNNVTQVKQNRMAGIVFGLVGGAVYLGLLFLFPAWSSGLVLGDVYAQYQREIFVVIGFYLIFMAMGSNGHILIARDQDNSLFTVNIMRAAISIILLFVLIPAIGIMGACLAFAAATFVTGLLLRRGADQQIRLALTDNANR